MTLRACSATKYKAKEFMWDDKAIIEQLGTAGGVVKVIAFEPISAVISLPIMSFNF